MKSLVIRNVRYKSRAIDMRVAGGRFSAVDESSGPASRHLIPGGFMDLHCHGAAGHKTIELTREAYHAISNFLARHGVTSFLATFSAAPFSAMMEYIRFAGNIMSEGLPGARLDGIYLEGPFLKNAGAMNPELLRRPAKKEMLELLGAGRGIIKIMTLAPELPGAMRLVELLSASDVVPAAGHSSSPPETLREAVKLGLRHVTHTGNNGEGDISCINSHYQHDGPLLEMLNNDGLTAEIITDGIHVDPQLVKLFYRAKGVNKCAAITDVCAAAGSEKGKTFFPNPLGQMEEFTAKNGALYIAGTEQLTGSLLTMDKAFMNVQKFAGLTAEEAAKSCGAVPRRIAGIDAKEKIEIGMKAEFTILSKDGTVEMTVADGKIIYQKKGIENE